MKANSYMTGSVRKLLEESDVDLLFYKCKSFFRVFDENYNLFAYQFFVFYHTQKDQRPHSLQEEKETGSVKRLTRRQNLGSNVSFLHISHENFWAFKGSEIEERTIYKFNLKYSDRHFHNEKKPSAHRLSDVDILSVKPDLRLFWEITKTSLKFIPWFIQLIINAKTLNASLQLQGLPKFPSSEFALRLILLKYNESIAKFNLLLNSYDEIYFSNYYSFRSLAICSAGKRLGIKTINLQHGIQGAKHPAFNFRAFIGQKLPQYVPDHFFCYYLAEKHNIIHPDITIGMHGFSTKIKRSQQVKSVLVSLQPSCPLDKDIVFALKRLAKCGILVKIKLHPRVNLEHLLISDLSNIQNIIILPRDLHITEALESVDAHITGFSSSAIDAAQIGVKTFFTDDSASDLYASLFIEGLAEVAGTADELVKRLLSND